MPDERLSRSWRSLSRSHLDRDVEVAPEALTDEDEDAGYLRSSVAGRALIRFLTTGMGEGLRRNDITNV